MEEVLRMNICGRRLAEEDLHGRILAQAKISDTKKYVGIRTFEESKFCGDEDFAIKRNARRRNVGRRSADEESRYEEMRDEDLLLNCIGLCIGQNPVLSYLMNEAEFGLLSGLFPPIKHVNALSSFSWANSF